MTLKHFYRFALLIRLLMQDWKNHPRMDCQCTLSMYKLGSRDQGSQTTFEKNIDIFGNRKVDICQYPWNILCPLHNESVI